MGGDAASLQALFNLARPRGNLRLAAAELNAARLIIRNFAKENRLAPKAN